MLEACLTAYLNYPGMIHAHPHVVPQPVDSYCNVYSLCRLMEQMTGGKFTCGQMADFYGGKVQLPANDGLLQREAAECETDGDAGRRAEGQVGEVRQGDGRLLLLRHPAGAKTGIEDVA